MMPASVLVGYATRYGSTQEVAELIAQVLREAGLQVDVQAVKNVRSIEKYTAFVLGAPLYIGALLKEMQRFLVSHSEGLKSRPVWFFALGPLNDDEKGKPDARQQLENALAKYSWLSPAGIQLFVGKYDPKKLRFPDSLLGTLPASPLYQKPLSDLRNWPEIRAWASSLAVKILSI
jgi:menaquinone-dependent protoporphyrinogen oxidase